MKRQEVIVCIYANEEFDTVGKGIAKLVSDCNLIDPIAQAHGYINEPETYIRGKDRIDFIFCTLNIAAFITASIRSPRRVPRYKTTTVPCKFFPRGNGSYIAQTSD